MIHVDPASPAFEELPRHRQASIYARMGWSVSAIAEELGIHPRNARLWSDPDGYARHREYQRNYRRTDESRARDRANYRKRRDALLAAGVITMGAAGRNRTFDYAKAVQLRADGLRISDISERLGVSVASIYVALRASKKGKA